MKTVSRLFGIFLGRGIVTLVVVLGGFFGGTQTAQAASTAPYFPTETPPPGAIGVGYEYWYSAGGSPSPKFSLASGKLPSGVTLSDEGLLKGTPTASGTYTGVVTASNGVSPDVSQAFSITIAGPSAPAFTAGPPPGGSYGIQYEYFDTVTGAPTPTVTVTSGALPPGLTLSGGLLWGIPTVAGTFSGVITASNGSGPDVTQAFSIVITPPSPPAIVSAQPWAGSIGVSYYFSCVATGAPPPTFSVSSGALPPGLTLDPRIGDIYGTPTASGTFTGVVSASNGVSPNGTQAFSITIAPPSPPVFVYTTPPAGTVGVAYTGTIAANGAPSPVMTVTSGALPPGLTMNSWGGISGTPTTAGTYTGVVTATNGVNPDATQAFSITISPVPPPVAPTLKNGPPPANGRFGVVYTFYYQTTGTPTPTFTVSSGSLPPGLALASDGYISGTPTTAGTYTGVITATNGGSPDATQAFSITISPAAAPTITNGPAPNALIGSSYYFTYQTSGAPSPTFTVSSGSLPPGFSLSQAGVISGMPTTAGTYTGSVTATNGISPDSTQAFSITVVPGTAPVFVNSPVAWTMVLGDALPFAPVSVTGNPAPTVQVTSGALPPGVQIVPFGSMLTGKPTQLGTYSGIFTASNGTLPNATQPFSIAVIPSIVASYSILHNFKDGTVAGDGTFPQAPLMQASDGNFYGTTPSGGSANKGTVFKLTPGGSETVLHSFGDGTVANDGADPVAGLVQGADGALYGTTQMGGINTRGTIFKITTSGTETVLHRFGDGSVANDGQFPYAALVLASDGNFYGTTEDGVGASTAGTVFRVTPVGAVTILHSFSSGPKDGAEPEGALIQGSDGNLYGTTLTGGSNGGGTVFKMSLSGTETILHSFKDGSVVNDGSGPSSPLIQAADGNFYGIAHDVFRMTPQGAVTILASVIPAGPLLQAKDENIYWAEVQGNAGYVLGMTPEGALFSLHNFNLTSGDGRVPLAGLIQGTDGDLYGTTAGGGSASDGTVYKIVLTPEPPIFTSANFATFTTGQAGSNLLMVFGAWPMSFSATGLPAWATLDPATGVLSGTPPDGAGSPFAITVTASNGMLPNATEIFTLTVNSPPVITNGPATTSATVGEKYTFAYSTPSFPAPTFSVISGALPTGLSLSTNGVILGWPTATGTFSGVIAATNGIGADATQAFNITVSATDTFATWGGRYFTAQQLADPTVSGPMANPGHDGTVNLLKYLFDINPTVTMGRSDRAALPQVAITTVNSVDYLTLTYRRNGAAGGITVNVQTSTDLANWTTVTPDLNTTTPIAGTNDSTVTVGVKATSAAAEFIRLNVTSP